MNHTLYVQYTFLLSFVGLELMSTFPNMFNLLLFVENWMECDI
jgi:hypothetical protein